MIPWIDYTNTNLKLNIITLQQDFESDKAKWLASMKQEYEDLKEEFEDQYEKELVQYRAEMKNWIETRRQSKEQHERQRTEKRDSSGKLINLNLIPI